MTEMGDLSCVTACMVIWILMNRNNCAATSCQCDFNCRLQKAFPFELLFIASVGDEIMLVYLLKILRKTGKQLSLRFGFSWVWDLLMYYVSFYPC